MLNQQQGLALRRAAEASRAAGHIYPQMAACEAMLESSWGTSELAVQGNNLFGCKQHQHPFFPSMNLPTREFLHGLWTVVDAPFIRYPALADCFADRMDTLTRLRDAYPHYARALAAATPEEFVTEVSRSWSTDPNRARTCIAIYRANRGCFA